jgi:predicted Zn-ribbon and HTH transcriptional regulator
MPKKVVQIEAKNPSIIAPCGINCSLCRTYIRDRQPCPGCRGGDSNKSNACLTCSIVNCMKLAAGNHQFCFSCANFPCTELLYLDRRYRTKYGVSVVANLERIQAVGEKRFVVEEIAKWTCPECGMRLCMHKPECGNCGYEWQVEQLTLPLQRSQ